MIKVLNRQEEALDQEEPDHQEEAMGQEEALDQEEPDHQEEAMEEEAQPQGEPRRSKQEEEQVIQDPLHLQVFQDLHVHQIHGVHLSDPGKTFRSSCYRPTTRHAAYWR